MNFFRPHAGVRPERHSREMAASAVRAIGARVLWLTPCSEFAGKTRLMIELTLTRRGRLAGGLVAVLVLGASGVAPVRAQAPAEPQAPKPATPPQLEPEVAVPPGAAAAARPATPAFAPVAIPALSAEDKARLLSALDSAAADGLDASAFSTRELRALLEASNPEQRRRGESQLVADVVRYARAQRGARVDPASVSQIWAVAPPPYDARRELAAAIKQDRVEAWLAALAPPYPGYQALRAAYGRYAKVAAEGGWPRIAAGAPLKPGASDARVPALRKRLALEGYAVGSATGKSYDAELADAVRRFQSRRGLRADGVVGPGATEALNVSAAARAQQIAANLERWRWLPRSLPDHRIEVNLVTAILDYYRDGTIPTSMRVVVGDLKHQTPMMTADIESIVLNPPWNVPASIVRNEIAPRLARDPGYLKREGLSVVGRHASGLPMLQQRPGPGSALGRVKFDSPNAFSVFLHDTPSRGGFSRADRLLSHGCVRLERPLDLARLVLADDPEWTPERMQATIDAGKTVRVSLAESLPMYLLYWSAYVDDKGGVYLWDDIYGWDGRLTTALNAAGAQLAAR